MTFAGFIMTYERPAIISETLEILFSQTLAPEKILIVDNSSSHETEALVAKLGNPRVEYYRVGFNGGPALAAKIGLTRLAGEYDWIYWGDDDDPPSHNDLFRDQLNFAASESNIGIVGRVGASFSRYTGRTSGYPNQALKRVMDVDTISGNQQMIVHRSVVQSGVLPTEKLFFGFEELDFCLKVKKAGFRIIFDGDKVKEGRARQGNDSPEYKWKGASFGRQNNVWRQYYSSRNILFILSQHGYYIAYIFNLTKILVKGVYAFRYGLSFGTTSAGVYWSAIVDHLTGNYGRKEFKKTT